ncbi:MAG: leucine-rich repeat protein [Prevotella sp.]|nr:leucine-rich repeat protein [Prevotella sp.]
MKQKKLLLVTALLLTVLWVRAADGDTFTAATVEGVELTYKIISEAEKTCQVGEGEINHWAYPSSENPSVVTIPSEVNGYRVTSIGSWSFNNKRDLININIPNTVVEVGESAFSGCRLLKDINLPDGLTAISDELFYDCQTLTSITIPAGVTSIGRMAFSSCSRLSCIHLPDGLKTIGESAFYYCNQLYTIDIPDGVTAIGNYAFGNSSILQCQLPAGLTAIPKGLFTWGKLKNIVIPDNVTTIEEAAFEHCQDLESVLIPSTMTNVDVKVFQYCSKLKTVRFLGDVPATLATDAFYYVGNSWFGTKPTLIVPSSYLANYQTKISGTSFCGGTFSGIQAASSDIPLSPYTANGIVYTYANGSYAVTGYDATTAETSSNKLIVASEIDGYTVTSIADDAFSNATSLLTITVPSSVKSIGERAFSGCSSLTKAELTTGLTIIGDYAFQNCASLVLSSVPTGIEKLGPVFEGCSNITSISLPTIKELNGTFKECTNLKYVYMYDGLSVIGTNTFTNTGLTMVTIPASVQTISAGAFKDSPSLTCIKFSGDIPANIDGAAFDGLGTVETPALLVVSMDYQPNYQAEFVEGKFYGGWFKIIATGALNGIVYDFYTDHYIVAGYDEATAAPLDYKLTIVSQIGGYDVTQIDHTGMDGSEHMKSIVIPATITVIGKGAFRDCSNLSLVVFEGDVPELYYGTCFDGVGTSENPAILCVPVAYVENYKNTFSNGRFDGGYFTLVTPSVDITTAAAGYATYYNSKADATLPAGLVAYTISGLASASHPAYKQVTGNIIPAGLAVMLYSAEGETAGESKAYTIDLDYTVTPDTEANNGNWLYGSDIDCTTATDGAAKYYKLSYSKTNSEQFGWHWGAADGAAFAIEGHRAWLALPGNMSSPSLTLPNHLGIMAVDGLKTDDTGCCADYHDMQGRVVKNPVRGLYIRNGKKVVVK